MSYVNSRSPALLRAALSGARRHRGFSGPLTITISHDGLGGLARRSPRRRQQLGAVDDGAAFANAVQAAADALDSLKTKATALQYVATDDQDKEIARLAVKFATITGPRGLQRAVDTGDGNEFLLMQRGIKGVTDSVTSALVDDVIERFLIMDVGILLVGPFGLDLSVLPPEALDAAREAAATIPTPPAPQELPLWMFVGGGSLTGGLMAFSSSGNPRASIAGAIGGGVLGALLQYGLQSLSDKFSLPSAKK